MWPGMDDTYFLSSSTRQRLYEGSDDNSIFPSILISLLITFYNGYIKLSPGILSDSGLLDFGISYSKSLAFPRNFL